MDRRFKPKKTLKEVFDRFNQFEKSFMVNGSNVNCPYFTANDRRRFLHLYESAKKSTPKFFDASVAALDDCVTELLKKRMSLEI